MDSEILEMLEDIGRSSVARLSPAIHLQGENAQSRRAKVLGAVRGTVLPRRLEFTAADGSVLAIEVNSSRITDVFRCDTGPVPDFETDMRETLTEQLARLMSDFALAPGPLELVSRRPDEALEADDVGITFSEVEAACAQIELPDEPQLSVVNDASVVVEAPPSSDNSPESLAERFYRASEQFASGRLLVSEEPGAEAQFEGLLAPDQPTHPGKELISAFARDLAGWQSDASPALPATQLIVMRPTGGKGAGLALLRDGRATAGVLHDARKLGAVVNLWKKLKDAAE